MDPGHTRITSPAISYEALEGKGGSGTYQQIISLTTTEPRQNNSWAMLITRYKLYIPS